MNSLLTLLEPYVQPAPEVLHEISTVLRKAIYSKGSILLQPGDVSDKIYFVKTGVLREFFIWEETVEEFTTQIVTEDTFFYSTLSFLSETPSNRILEVVEDCVLITIKKNDLEYWCKKVHGIEHFIRIMLEQMLIRAEKRTEILRHKKPEERLEVFERLHPELLNRIPLGYIASFLNIAPQTLSKVRRGRFFK